MKYLMLAALAAASFAGPVSAGQIQRACLQSDRAQGNRALCGCIQQAADLTLSNRDQSRAAKLFRDPDKAQELRQSGRRGDEEFWLRYRSFGETAEAFCS
jgi:hypothetical protein